VAAARDALDDDPSLTAEERARLDADLDRVLGNLKALAGADLETVQQWLAQETTAVAALEDRLRRRAVR
jgi:hypothetical protein